MNICFLIQEIFKSVMKNLNQICNNIIENLLPEQIISNYFTLNRGRRSYHDLLDYFKELNLPVLFWKKFYEKVKKELTEEKLFIMSNGDLSKTKYREY